MSKGIVPEKHRERLGLYDCVSAPAERTSTSRTNSATGSQAKRIVSTASRSPMTVPDSTVERGDDASALPSGDSDWK